MPTASNASSWWTMNVTRVLTLMTLLRHEGHEVRGLHRAQDVMPAVKDFDPDVVVIDVALPDGSGLCDRRANPPSATAPDARW